MIIFENIFLNSNRCWQPHKLDSETSNPANKQLPREYAHGEQDQHGTFQLIPNLFVVNEKLYKKSRLC